MWHAWGRREKSTRFGGKVNLILYVNYWANEVGRACGTHGRREKCTRFWWESKFNILLILLGE
jgi:hypothetical protein